MVEDVFAVHELVHEVGGLIEPQVRGKDLETLAEHEKVAGEHAG